MNNLIFILFFIFFLVNSSNTEKSGEKSNNDTGEEKENKLPPSLDDKKNGTQQLNVFPQNLEEKPKLEEKDNEEKEELIKQLPNNITTIVQTDDSSDCFVQTAINGSNSLQFVICSPKNNEINFIMGLEFKSDPRTNGGEIPLAFQFCPPKELPKKNEICDEESGYLVCYISQLDPDRKEKISLKYAIGKKSKKSVFADCDKEYENLPPWNDAGPKHGFLVTYLSGGQFRFSASYTEKEYIYNVGEGNCLLMRLFENDTFLSGAYATGNNVSKEPIYPIGEKLYASTFVKFANGLLLEDTDFVGPWLLGADIFLRFQTPLPLVTYKKGKEFCLPKFSYMTSVYKTKYSDVTLATHDKFGFHRGRSYELLALPFPDKLSLNHSFTKNLQNVSCLIGLDFEGDDCKIACSNNASRQNGFAFNYTSDPECQFLAYRTKSCSCLALNGTFITYAKKNEKNNSIIICFDGDKISHGNQTEFKLPSKCKINSIGIGDFKEALDFKEPFILSFQYKNVNINCTGLLTLQPMHKHVYEVDDLSGKINKKMKV